MLSREEVALGAEPRLIVSGCRRRPAREAGADGSGAVAGRGEARGEVAVTVTAEDGRRVAAKWPVAGEPGWWSRELDLGPLAGERVRVELASVAGPRRLFLRELRVEHLAPMPPRRDRPPQILLISIDTLRHDALGVTGGGASTPALDLLAAGGETFTPHWAGATWTKPSHAEMLTGYGAGVHGVIGPEDPIHPAVPTLAERFRAGGFRTAGLVYDCVWLEPKFGFDRGFESYRSVGWGAEPMVRGASDWMIEHRDQPFFYFLHLFDAHSDFSVLPYEGPGITQETVEVRFGLAEYGCRQGACASWLLNRINDGEIAPLPGEAEVLRFLYDRGVERVDGALGRLLARLAAAGLYHDLLIAFTSDHGEAFLEHGVVSHGWELEEVLRVPLIVKWPRGERAGSVREVPSGAVDLARTLLAAAELPGDGLPGADLRRRRADRPVFAGSDDWVVIDGGMKAIFEKGGRPPRLYDLAADPGERHDLATERSGALARLRALHEARLAADRRQLARLAAADRERPGNDPALTPEERSRLRSLGYLGDGDG